MTTVAYKIGDRVRIKSLDWYNENKMILGETKRHLFYKIHETLLWGYHDY